MMTLTLGLVLLGLVGLAVGFVKAGGEPERSNLAPYVYSEDFETGELRAWASYPPNQDTAYDPYIYPGRVLPGDPARCLIVKCEPLWNEDQTLGAVKLLDMVLHPRFSIRFRYFFKTTLRGVELLVHLPLADGRRLVYRKADPAVNEWAELDLSWADLAGQELVGGDDRLLTITALAITAEVPRADPDLPVFLGLDDVEVRGLREKKFDFSEPRMTALEEWPERIPLRHYREGESLRLAGRLDFSPGEVELALAPLTQQDSIVHRTRLSADAGGLWRTAEVRLDPGKFPAGLYRGVITASRKGVALSRTPFLVFVEPRPGEWSHPRVLVGVSELDRFRSRLQGPEFRGVFERFMVRAKTYREQVRLDKIVCDIDQFPEKDWVASLPAWYKDRFMTYREALFTNAVTCLSGQDDSAGPFIKALLLKLAAWPRWNHPWMEARGFHTYYPLGEFADAFAIAYDTAFDLMSDEERRTTREGLLRNYVKPAFATYVEQNQVTANSSNWISHIAGGGLVSLLAMAHDSPDLADLEPWLSGFLLKMHKYISTVFGADGSYGEGFRYYNFAMQSLARTLPALERLFHIDLAGPVIGSHRETLWASIVPRNISFGFGDTESYLKQEAQAWWIGTENGPMNSWAWLLDKTKDPGLAWLYRGLKEFDTLQEVLHDVSGVSVRDPSSLGAVRFFPDVGTAVFRSGWREEDFVFVLRSGPFFNHQHLDQGSFYLADRGEIFLEERYDGEHHYYDDPVYRSHAIQPISHNTILIDRNPQSQRVGDPKGFAAGLSAQARLESYLDAEGLAFVSGDIGAVYRGKVRSLRRNVLYLKPRAVLIVDEALPAERDVEVNLLFHTRWKKDIAVGPDRVAFSKDKGTLFLYPLLPDEVSKEIIGEPHFLYQYGAQPLIERGYLQISAQTRGRRLILANFLTTAGKGEPAPVVEVARREEGASLRFPGAAGGWALAVGSGSLLSLGEWSTDGLLLAVGPDGSVFAADAGSIAREGLRLVGSQKRFAGQVHCAPGGITARLRFETRAMITLNLAAPPRRVLVDGRPLDPFAYDPEQHALKITLPKGVTRIQVEYER
jgi:hypothetical protein